MAVAAENPLLSTGRASDSSLTVQLHPLVLLTISDYITRHTLREQEGPVIGAIIGQQNGREVTMEFAFQCKLKPGEPVNGEQRVIMDEEWFAMRLEQFKDVHKAPALDLVAIFTLGPTTGPLPQHIPILQQLQHTYNDDLILVLFHPEIVFNGGLTGGKLPISLYESYYEPGSEDADKGLQVDGWGMGQALQMRFRELGYEVETGEAEMIGVDFVAKGAGNASAINPAGAKQETSDKGKTSSKGKGKAIETNGTLRDIPLSAEDEELIASLTGKANAIRMLHQRINLLKSYLSTLPPSYLTDAATTNASPETTQLLNHHLLRNISSLLSRLPLLAPPSASSDPTTATASNTLATASAKEESDVHLVSLLSALTRTVAETREFGTKYSVVQRARTDRKMGIGGGLGAGGGLGGAYGRFGAASEEWTPESGGMEFS